jgi:hypothetical protein
MYINIINTLDRCYKVKILLLTIRTMEVQVQKMKRAIIITRVNMMIVVVVMITQEVIIQKTMCPLHHTHIKVEKI